MSIYDDDAYQRRKIDELWQIMKAEEARQLKPKDAKPAESNQAARARRMAERLGISRAKSQHIVRGVMPNVFSSSSGGNAGQTPFQSVQQVLPIGVGVSQADGGDVRMDAGARSYWDQP